MSAITRKLKHIFIIIIFIAGIIGYGFYNDLKDYPFAEAATAQNVRGFAWSSNIGWISFNSLNCDTDDDGKSEGVAADGGVDGCPVLNSNISAYGVNLDASNVLSGYAWSQNIGWISFNWPDIKDAGINICPRGTTDAVCQARLVGGTDFYGWARSCSVFQAGCSGALKSNSERGDWDGWIKLRKDPDDAGAIYGVSLNGTDFEGFAWGSDVLGWVSFNSKNCDSASPLGQSDGGPGCPSAGILMSAYKVYLLSTPYVESLTAVKPDYCSNSPQFSLQWRYKNISNVDQDQYRLQVAISPGDPGFLDPVVDITISQNIAPDIIGSQLLKVVPVPTASIADFDIAYNRSYFWRIKVKDENGNWSPDWVEYNDFSPIVDDGDSAAKTFTTDIHMWPEVGFTPPEPDEFLINVPLPFKATGNLNPDNKPYYNSVCYDIFNISTICKEFYWDFCAGEVCTNKNGIGEAIDHIYDVKDSYDVILRVTDFDDRFCLNSANSKALEVMRVFWKEVVPK